MTLVRTGLVISLAFALVLAGNLHADGDTPSQTPEVDSELTHLPYYSAESVEIAYETAQAIITITDAARERDIELRITAPIVDGIEHSGADPEQSNTPSFPIIVFSHGLGGSHNAFPRAADLWASAGYVVIMPTHADSGLRSILSMSRGDGPLFDPEMWKSRVLDQKAVLDQLDGIRESTPILHALTLNTDRIASAGHSFGSQTASIMAGAILTAPDGSSIDMRDERVDIAIPISVQLPGQVGYTDDSYANMSIPLLKITGTKDQVRNGASGYARARVFDYYPEGDKHLLFIDEAAHSSFQDRSSMNRATRSITKTGNDPAVDKACALHTRLVALAFLDAYLKDDPFAKAWLMTNGPASIGASTALWKTR